MINIFQGSPHIDTTNVGPFYGLAFGDFADGTGGIRVELDPMTVCEVNTKGRLGKVDGRYPHWVAEYVCRLPVSKRVQFLFVYLFVCFIVVVICWFLILMLCCTVNI